MEQPIHNIQNKSDKQQGDNNKTTTKDDERNDQVHKQLQHGHALLHGINELTRQQSIDTKALKNKEEKMEECEDGLNNLLDELKHCENIKHKFEGKQLSKIAHFEAEAIKMAKELEQMESREHIAQAQYINDIEQYRNQMKILAQELATDYRNQRKSIQSEIDKLFDAENRAKDKLQMLVKQKEMTEKESIQKETELNEEERLARKQASELGQIDDAGEREVQECAADLEFALEELDLAKDAAKKFARKKEEAKKHLEAIIADESILLRRIEMLQKRIENEKSELHEMSDELGKVEDELEEAENLAKRLSREKKEEKKHARDEISNESTQIREMHEMIVKLNKERIALEKKAFELKAMEYKFKEKYDGIHIEEDGNKSDRKEKK